LAYFQKALERDVAFSTQISFIPISLFSVTLYFEVFCMSALHTCVCLCV